MVMAAATSGVPAQRVGEQEQERLDKLESRLNAEIVGQQQAVAFRMAGLSGTSRTGLGEPGTAHQCYAVLGPTGVGKRPHWRGHWRSAGSAARKRCSNLICRSIRSSTPPPGCRCAARLP